MNTVSTCTAATLREEYDSELILILQFTARSPHGTSLKMVYDSDPANENWAKVATKLQEGVKAQFSKILSELNGLTEPEPVEIDESRDAE